MQNEREQEWDSVRSKLQNEIVLFKEEQMLNAKELRKLKIENENLKTRNACLDKKLIDQRIEYHQTLQNFEIIKVQLVQSQIDSTEKDNKFNIWKHSYIENLNTLQDENRHLRCYLINNSYSFNSCLPISTINTEIQKNSTEKEIIPPIPLSKFSQDLRVPKLSFSDFSDSANSNCDKISENGATSQWSSASQLDRLQLMLQNKESQIEVLKMENQKLNKASKFVSDEMTHALNSHQEIISQVKTIQTLKMKYNELNTKYQNLLEMFGEKSEQNQELQLDLKEIKEMYKIQTEELINRLSSKQTNI